MDKVFVWAIIENIVLLIVSGLLAYFVSPWCLFMLLLSNSIRLGKQNEVNEEKVDDQS